MSLKSKGQIFTLDLLLSISIFFIIIGAAVLTLNVAWENQNRFNEVYYLEQKAFQITDLMVRSSGHPENWNSTNVKIIGVSSPSHVVQRSYLNELSLVSDRELKRIWQLKNETKYYINITAGGFNWTKGKEWNKKADYIIPQTRAIIFNSSDAFERGNLRFVLWQ